MGRRKYPSGQRTTLSKYFRERRIRKQLFKEAIDAYATIGKEDSQNIQREEKALEDVSLAPPEQFRN